MLSSLPVLCSPPRSLCVGVAIVCALTGGGVLGVSSANAAADEDAAAAKEFRDKVEPIFATFCYDCHGDGMDKGDFAMDDYESLKGHFDNMGMWFEVWKNTRAALMPPADKKQPTDAERDQMLAFIEREVFKIDPENPDPGAVTIRRLNREEYRNTIRDLFGVNFDVNDAFPADDTGYGFDTIGDVLSISPLLMEKYLEAAQDVVAEAISVEGPQIPTHWFNLKDFSDPKNEKHSFAWLPLDADRTMQGKPWVNYSGEQKLQVEFIVKGSNEATSQTGTLTVGLDGKELVSRKVGWDNSKGIRFETKVNLKRGREHQFTVSMQPGDPPAEGENKIAVEIKYLRVHGPLDGSSLEYPHEFRKIFTDGPPPDGMDERDPYREKILRNIATKAFRRPVDQGSLARLVQLARTVDEQEGKRFEHGIAHAVTAILASPKFLLRAEFQPEPDNAGKVVPLDEFAIASRLSYFLWSSCPDDELLKLAGEGKLRENLRAQVDRMLADWKSERFVSNFVGQWLQARDIETLAIDSRRILGDNPENISFNGDIRRAMRDETEQFFAHILKENRPATELLTANYTFLNERLANWYGIDGVKGNDMQKVDLAGSARRGGLLRQGTFLVVTSNPTRTSPVKRGLFVLENLLATPAPPAAPDVPALEAAQKGKNKDLPLREILKIHSEEKLCASCHARFDPIGLALENYNPLGLWVDDYKGQPIDTAGKLVTGEPFDDAGALSQILADARSGDFHRALTEKLMTFAIGRGIEFYDAPSIDKIVARAETKNGTLREIVYGIIESPPFQKRRGDGDVFGGK